jgi:hypothetical protein
VLAELAETEVVLERRAVARAGLAGALAGPKPEPEVERRPEAAPVLAELAGGLTVEA